MRNRSPLHRFLACGRQLTVLISATVALGQVAASQPAVEELRAPVHATSPLGSDSGAVFTRDLSGAWLFAYTPESTQAVPDSRWFVASVPVPGAWDDALDQAKVRSLWPNAKFNPKYKPIVFPYSAKPPDTSLPFLSGTGWYRQTLEVPADWINRTVTLHVGQVVTEATVFLNGRPIGSHHGHWTEWEIALTPHLRFGAANDLVIAVTNTKSRGSTRLRGWAGTTGGIFAPVSLKVTAGPARVASLFVYPESGHLRWNVRLEGPIIGSHELEWSVLENGRPIFKGTAVASSNDVSWLGSATGLGQWSDRDPKLYELVVSLENDRKIIDVRRQRFGLRHLVAEGTELKLNGAPIYLRGHCDHFYFPETCTPALDKESYRRKLTVLKELGFNWLRFHTWVPPEPYLEAADELGFLIQVEGGDGMDLDEWKDIVRVGRVHPSVVIYCIGNEQLLDEPRIQELARFAQEQKALAPDGLFNPQEGDRGIIRSAKEDDHNNGFGTPLLMTPAPHNPVRLAAVSAYSDVFSPHLWGDLSYHSLTGDWREIERRMQIMKKPCFVHEAGIAGCYLDLYLAERYANTRIGPDLYVAAKAYLEQRGVADRASIYFRNSAAWQRLMYKDMLETTRKIRTLAGYSLLGAVDMHWHRTGYEVGMLNEFFELKPGQSVAAIRSSNGESVLLIDDQRQRVLGPGERRELELRVSWFGQQSISNGRLSWSLKASDGMLIGSGGWNVNGIQPGSVASMGHVTLSAPKVEEPKKVCLTVTLTDDSGTIANLWDFWIFPPPPRVPDNRRLVVTKTLDRSVIDKLVGGDVVVLLGGDPLPRRALSFQQGIGGRPEQNLATVIGRHPITDAFPHDGYFDWQFYRMTSKATSVVFDSLPVPFTPIIEVANSYKQVILQSALFEWRVGKGRLIVCTLNLDERFPESAYFKALILCYAAGVNQVMAPEIKQEDLVRLIERPRLPVRKLDGDDQGVDPRAREPKKI